MFSFLIPLLDVVKLVIASVTSVVFLAFAGLTLAGSAVALVVSTPLFLIFSPILVPATIATALLATGLTAGATLGVTAIGLIIGLIKTAEGSWLALAQRPLKMLKFSGGYSGSWGGKTFSGTFGNKSGGGAAPAGGSKPAGGFTWSWNGKSFSGTIPEWLKNQPWFKGLPPGGAAPAAGAAAPAAGAASAAGAAAPAAGAAAPAAGAAAPAAGAAAPSGGAAPASTPPG